MSSLFIYDFVAKGDKAKTEKEEKRIAVIFHSQSGLISESSYYAVRDFVNQTIPADEIFLLVSRSLDDEILAAIASDKRLQQEVRPRGQDAMRTVTFDAQGQLNWFCPGADNHTKKLPASLSQHLCTEGLRTIFERRDGLLKPSTTHHYTKPSGKHSNLFIRAGNVLCNSSEINFIGLCLLPHITQNTTHVYTDTSAISAAAYAVIFLRSQFSNTNSTFVIDSFRSYEGLKNFRFHGADTAVVLLSASTSGDLVDKIMAKERQFDTDRIVTLFYLSKRRPKGKVLCDLNQTSPIHRGIDHIISFQSEDECEFCRKGSMCINIFGEQFLLGNPKVSEYLVTAQDVPKELSSFVEQFLGWNIIKCYFDDSNNDNERKREIFIDVKALFDAGLDNWPRLEKRWKRNVAQAVPATLKRIVHLDDKASVALAEIVKGYFQASNPTRKDDVLMESAGDILKQPKAANDADFSDQANVVVCGCMCTGRKLMSVSQSLREIAPGSAITYLVGISRAPELGTFREIKSNLTYGEMAGDYGFSYIQSIRCHDNSPRLRTSWDDEEEVLKALRAYSREGKAKEWIEKRISTLNTVGSKGGLCKNVFWPEAGGVDLELRQGTAFVSFSYQAGQITQAEVFFLVSSTLQSLRKPDISTAPLNDSPLMQHEHHRVLLAPQCFYRFNDGVIQAAFLRAATRAELSYKVSSKHSERMRDVLAQILENWDNNRGEACGEFLLAMATGKLQLMDNHTIELLKEWRERHNLSPHLQLFSWFVQKTVELNPKPWTEDEIRRRAAQEAWREITSGNMGAT